MERPFSKRGALWSVENPWDVVTGENILVFIMFELTLPAKTSISRPHAGFLVVYPRFRQGYFIRTESTLIFLLLDHPRNESQFRDQWFVGLVHLC